ncbi:hypothetical protein GCM10023195_73300 [Actinoallomurus liliacearum]|uniref:FBA domain-containing protein n=1 Tax=Actinoallomurus liliacearum TaxID=1080073 RepID=A0ABP8TU21_9ACTN
MMNGKSHSRDMHRLVELCRELAKLDLHVGVSDARPALSARGDLTDRKVWVEIDAGSFVWRRDDLARHPVDDPVGAAACLADYLKNRDTESGHRPRGRIRPCSALPPRPTCPVARRGRRRPIRSSCFGDGSPAWCSGTASVRARGGRWRGSRKSGGWSRPWTPTS